MFTEDEKIRIYWALVDNCFGLLDEDRFTDEIKNQTQQIFDELWS